MGKKGSVNLSILRIQNIEGQVIFGSSFERRVNEEYIIPRESSDLFVNKEGLYPCSVVPRYLDGNTLSVVYKAQIVCLNLGEEEKLFEKNIQGFEQKVVERYIVPRKGRMYFSESEWRVDDSPEGLYTSLIFPKYLVGRLVTLIVEK